MSYSVVNHNNGKNSILSVTMSLTGHLIFVGFCFKKRDLSPLEDHLKVTKIRNENSAYKNLE